MSKIARFGSGAKEVGGASARGSGGGSGIGRPTTRGVTSPRTIPGGGPPTTAPPPPPGSSRESALRASATASAPRTAGISRTMGLSRTVPGEGGMARAGTTPRTGVPSFQPKPPPAPPSTSRLAAPKSGNSIPRTVPGSSGRSGQQARSASQGAVSKSTKDVGGASRLRKESLPKGKGSASGLPKETRESIAAKTAESIKIYTDWANHYLEKARNKRVITDLQVDICDGVILAEVIEAVTNQKVRDIKTKPRNSQQMVDNINQCLTFLSGLGVSVEGLSAKDIKDGNLKAILGLFFSLSRFKQQQKSAQQQLQHNLNQNSVVSPTSDSGRSSTGSASNANANSEMLSRLPSPFSKGGSKCPTIPHPGTQASQKEALVAAGNQNLNKNRTTTTSGPSPTERHVSEASLQNNNNPPAAGAAARRPQEKSRLLPKGGSSSSQSKTPSRDSVSTSRSTSPSSSVSNIPTPGGRSGIRAPGSLSGVPAGGRLASATSTSSCASSASGASSSTRSSSTAASKQSALGAGANNKNSMLDKFKFFKGDKKSGVAKGSSSSKKGASSVSDNKDVAAAASAEKAPQPQPGAGSAVSDGKGSISRQSSHTEQGAAGGGGSGGSPKLSSKSSSSKKTFGLKKKEASSSTSSKDESKRGMSTSTSSSFQQQGKILSVNGNSSSSGAKRSTTSSKTDRSNNVDQNKGSSSSSTVTSANSSPQATRKASKLAAPKLSSKTSKSTTSTATNGSGIPPPSSGIPKPGSRSASKSSKEESKLKVPSNSSSTKERGTNSAGQRITTSSLSRSTSPRPIQDTQDANHSDSLRKGKGSNQVQIEDLVNVQRHVRAAAMAAADNPASKSTPEKPTPPQRTSSMSASSTPTHTAKPIDQSQLQQQQHHQQLRQHQQQLQHSEQQQQHQPQQTKKHAKIKPQKVDSDTQTHASAVAVAHARMRETGQEQSNQSLSSESSANASSGENSKSSTSNSNNSVSSNDSVIFRPSSCDELESGIDSDTNVKTSTDHISNLRRQNASNLSSPSSPGGQGSLRKERASPRDFSPLQHQQMLLQQQQAARKMETTFDTEVRTETLDVHHQHPSRETTFGDEQEEVYDIKPMPPIMRSTPYAYLRNLNPGPLPRPSFHMSNTLQTGNANSASSRLGVNRPLIDPSSFHSKSMRRTISNGNNTSDSEYAHSMIDGYMSDGDVLHSSHHHHQGCDENNSGYFSDVNSGYLSEGGATLYAKKMQQRFREGMAAVKECMQKSANIQDEDRYVRHGLQYHSDHSGAETKEEHFDDSSSISSGEISDTINEISTDDNITGSSISAGSEHNHPYGSLKRVPLNHSPFSHQSKFGLLKSGNGLLDRGREHGDFSLRKYLIGGDRSHSADGRSCDTSLERTHWNKDRNGGPHPIYRTVEIPPAGSFLRKQVPGGLDPRSGQQHGTGYAVEDPNLKNSYLEAGGSNASSPHHHHSTSAKPPAAAPIKEKRDSETNTDHTLMLRKGQAGRPPQGSFGLRRPLSNVSTGSTGSNKSGGSIGGRQIGVKLTETEKAHQRGERLANYTGSMKGVQKTASGTQTGASSYHKDPTTDMGPEAYSASTLERRRRSGGHNLVTSKSQSTVAVNAGQAPASGDEYRSSTLGRKRPDVAIRERLFGSRSSLNGKAQTSEGAPTIVNGTIISNPHATFSKQDPSLHHNYTRSNTYSGPSSSSICSTSPGSNYVNISYNQHSDYLNNRPASAMSNPTSPSGSPWIKSAPPSLHNGAMRGTLSETESMESISSSASSSIQAQIQQARAHGLLSKSILQHEKDIQTGQIQRSDSFRSTQSEKMFPSTSQPDGLQRTSSFSQIHHHGGHPPPSPTPSNSSHASSRYTYPGMTPMSPTSTAMGLVHSTSTTSSSMPYGLGLPLSKISSKDEDIHGSALSLVSSCSSVYSTADEKAAAEILKLRLELESAQVKVSSLSGRLHNNAHVVAAFEQSLSTMTTRLQQLTNSSEQKDSELNELRQTIEALKQQSGIHFSPEHGFSTGSLRRPSSSNTSTLSREPSTPGEPPRISRHMSSDSMSSINSLSSACSATSQQSSATDTDSAKKKKKGKSWLRSSFSKAFSRKKNKHGSISDVEPDTASLRSDCSVPNSPLLHNHNNSAPASTLKASHSSHALCEPPPKNDKDVMKLQVALHEKDMKLTDIRLEALSSAHQLEQLRETMNRMKNEMASLKADNSRLQQLVSKKGLSHPECPVPQGPTSPTTLEKRLSLEAPSNLELLLNDNADREGRRITISVFMTSEVSKLSEARPTEVLVGAISVSGKTKWEMLDVIVRRVFKEYVLRIDPVTNLGLTTESVNFYNIGDLLRSKEIQLPELLPCGYLVGEHTNITLTLKGSNEHSVEALAFETLIPKSIVQRYVSLLLEHRRIILCGPSGTGKTYLAQKLAEYLVLKSGKELTAGLIATFNVDHKSSKELRQYLANIADQCESTSAGELPSVIILDNLHHVTSLGEVFNGFLSVKYQKCPYIIGTMNQATCSTTNLQLHHNFRWVLCANHMEPVKGFLGRYLRRKLVEAEIQTRARNNDLAKIVDWMPKVWQHLNKFLETHSSSDVTIGPRLFLSCPMDVPGSQVWFTDLWNYSIVPYLLEAVREGIQAHGRRTNWEDPADWVIETYPWPQSNDQDWPSLLRLRPEDVGYETQGAAQSSGKNQGQGTAASDTEGDPLLNMLMRLQEAASYSSPQSADSDSTSLDSHSSGVQEFTSTSNTSGTNSADSTL